MPQRKPKPITTLAQLADLSVKRRCVWSRMFICCAKPRPAAFMLGLPGRELHRIFLSRALYVYEKPARAASKPYYRRAPCQTR